MLQKLLTAKMMVNQIQLLLKTRIMMMMILLKKSMKFVLKVMMMKMKNLKKLINLLVSVMAIIQSEIQTSLMASVLIPEPGWSSRCVPGVARPPPQPQHRVAHLDMSLANGSVQLKPDVMTHT